MSDNWGVPFIKDFKSALECCDSCSQCSKKKYGKIREYYNPLTEETTIFLLPDEDVEKFDNELTIIYKKEEVYKTTGNFMLYEDIEDELRVLIQLMMFSYNKFVVEDELYDLDVVIPKRGDE